MTDTSTDKKLSERFSAIKNDNQFLPSRASEAYGAFCGQHWLDILAALRLAESRPSTGASRNASWQDGRRNGIKWAVEYLHSEARSMNDWHAKMVLNNAAFHMGTAAKASIKDAPDHPSAIADPVRRDWCEEHNRGSLEATDGLCPECEERKRARHPSTIREAVEVEREACANVAAQFSWKLEPSDSRSEAADRTCLQIAAAIRARGEEKGNG